jgi:hypothetical protein
MSDDELLSLRSLTPLRLAELYAAMYDAGVLAGQLSRLHNVFIRGVAEGVSQTASLDDGGAHS